MAEEDTSWLAEHGYGTEPYDVCWLDCSLGEGGAAAPGYLKAHGSREICLCLAHARFLESGKVSSSYRGAPTPPDSVAAEWPWRTAGVVSVEIALPGGLE